MRKLNTGDCFAMARLLNKVGSLRDVFVELMEKGKEKDANVEEMGMTLFFTLITDLSNQHAEDDIYILMGGIMEVDPKDIKNQPLVKTLDNLKEIARENDLSRFFKFVDRLPKR